MPVATDGATLPVAVADVAAEATALVEAEIAAATAAGRVELATVPSGPSLPTFVRDVPDGPGALAPSFLMQLGCDPDTPLDDVYCIPEDDLTETLGVCLI